jgi:hypothetical protein
MKKRKEITLDERLAKRSRSSTSHVAQGDQIFFSIIA